MATRRRARPKQTYQFGRSAVRPTEGLEPVAARETITLDRELVHDILDFIDFYLREGDEGPRHDSRGNEIWQDEWPNLLSFVFELETRLKGRLAEVEMQKAIAEALAAHRVTQADPAALAPSGERP